jgi:hypothetical protein
MFPIMPSTPPGLVFITHGHDKSILDQIDEAYDKFISGDIDMDHKIAESEKISADKTNEIHQHHLKLSPDEIRYMHEYTSAGLFNNATTGSEFINKHLWDSYNQGKVTPTHFNYQNGHTVDLNKLNSIISKNKLNKSLITFSGIKFDPMDHVVNNRIINAGHISSSLHHEIAVRYAESIDGIKHVLAIHHNTGDRGLYIPHRSGLSPFNEYEYVMPRNTILHIDPTPIRGVTSVHGHNVMTWKATRI